MPPATMMAPVVVGGVKCRVMGRRAAHKEIAVRAFAVVVAGELHDIVRWIGQIVLSETRAILMWYPVVVGKEQVSA